jgi:hypothetical protein
MRWAWHRRPEQNPRAHLGHGAARRRDALLEAARLQAEKAGRGARQLSGKAQSP